MSEQPAGPVLDGLGITLDLGEGDLEAGVRCSLSVTTRGPTPRGVARPWTTGEGRVCGDKFPEMGGVAEGDPRPVV